MRERNLSFGSQTLAGCLDIYLHIMSSRAGLYEAIYMWLGHFLDFSYGKDRVFCVVRPLICEAFMKKKVGREREKERELREERFGFCLHHPHQRTFRTLLHCEVECLRVSFLYCKRSCCCRCPNVWSVRCPTRLGGFACSKCVLNGRV